MINYDTNDLIIPLDSKYHWRSVPNVQSIGIFNLKINIDCKYSYYTVRYFIDDQYIDSTGLHCLLCSYNIIFPLCFLVLLYVIFFNELTKVPGNKLRFTNIGE